jgi:hypothetical protein
MNKLDPKVAGAFVAVLVIIAGIIIFKTTIGNKLGEAPPIMSGGPSTGSMSLPGKDTAVKGAGGGGTGQSGNVLPGAPPMGGGGMTAPGGGGTAPGGGGMALPGAPPGP